MIINGDVITAIAQDAKTKQILMPVNMNKETLIKLGLAKLDTGAPQEVNYGQR